MKIKEIDEEVNAVLFQTAVITFPPTGVQELWPEDVDALGAEQHDGRAQEA